MTAGRSVSRQVVVTGLGPVTSIGVGADAFHRGQLAGTSGARLISRFDSRQAGLAVRHLRQPIAHERDERLCVALGLGEPAGGGDLAQQRGPPLAERALEPGLTPKRGVGAAARRAARGVPRT